MRRRYFKIDLHERAIISEIHISLTCGTIDKLATNPR